MAITNLNLEMEPFSPDLVDPLISHKEDKDNHFFYVFAFFFIIFIIVNSIFYFIT